MKRRLSMTLGGLLAAMATCTAWGQTNPTPVSLPYSQNFGTTDFSTYPAGFAGWNGVSGAATSTQPLAEATVPTGNATLISGPAGTSGGLYGDGNAGNGRAVVVTSSNTTNGVNQWVLAVNTTGASNVTVSFDFISVVANVRTVGCVLQYRVGTAGPWTTALGTGLPYVQSGGVAGTVTPASVTLGSEANNQPEVQIRWAVWRGTEAGSSSAFAIDNVSVLGGGQDPTGSCCVGFECFVNTQAQCNTAGGIWTSGGVCDPNPCLPPPTGACCINGFCIGEITESECLATSGAVWGGADTNCGTYVCPVPLGRCCLPDFTCVEMISEADCLNQGGSGWVLNGFCDNFTCVPTSGACCLPNQTCVVAEPADCNTQNGVFMGRGVACIDVSCVPASGANLVAKYDFDVNRAGIGRNLSFTFSPTGPFTSAGDAFGVYQRFYSASIPFTLLDDSLSIFELDAIGIVDETTLDKWFGVNDLLNNDNLPGTGTATWTFDISGFSNLSISIDMAAMGDFEATAGANDVPDLYSFSVSIDGGAPVVVFDLVPDEAGTQMYTMAGGAMFTLDDPLRVNGTTYLNNVLQTLVASIPGTGSVLTLSFSCSNNADEAFVFDNIMIMGETGGPATGACCMPNGTCSVQTAADCGTMGGSYLGNGAACSQAACDALSVACCLNNSCTVTNLGGCLFQGGTVDSFGNSCAGSECGPAFCDADWCQDGEVGVPDIFCFLSAWFSMDPEARCYGGQCDVPAIFAFLSIWFATGQGPCTP